MSFQVHHIFTGFFEFAAPLRCIYGLPEVPIWFPIHNPGGNPVISEQPAYVESSTHDAFTRCPGLPGLRLVGILDSAVVALRWLVARLATAGGAEHTLNHAAECGCCNVVDTERVDIWLE